MAKKEGFIIKPSCWHACNEEGEDEAPEAVEENAETKVALEAVETVEENAETKVALEAVETVEENPQTEVALVGIGTRGSPLALAQAYETQEKLMAKHQLDRSSRRPTPSNTECLYRKAQPPPPAPPKKESLLASFCRAQRERKQEAGQEAGTAADRFADGVQEKELSMNVENAAKSRVDRKLCKEAEQEAGTEQAGKRTPARFADRFADYENPKAIKPRRLKEKERFIILENAAKYGKVRQLCKEQKPAVVCCLFGSEVEDVSSYLGSKHVAHAKLHRDVYESRQYGAIRSFNENGVDVLVITLKMLLKATISRCFHLINFEIPICFEDYDSLVRMPKLGTVTTILNEKSGIGLKLLVKAVQVPEAVKTLADKV